MSPASSSPAPPKPSRPLAVVTGASSGLGLVFARALAARGCDLLVVARREDRLRELARDMHAQHGVDTTVHVADLCDARAVDELARVLRALAVPPAVLVNNAGFGLVRAVVDSDPQLLARMVRLNVNALTDLTLAALPAMVAAGGGAIVNVASTAAFQPLPGFATYAATKAFVLAFSEALHVEVRGRVRVLALCPGSTATEFGSVADAGGIVAKFPSMTAEAVVSAALRAMDRGRPLCVPGLTNRIQAVLSQVSPRALVRRISERLFFRKSG